MTDEVLRKPELAAEGRFLRLREWNSQGITGRIPWRARPGAVQVDVDVVAQGLKPGTAIIRSNVGREFTALYEYDIATRKMGAPLFERVPRGMRLLPRGQVLLRHARSILAAVDDAAAQVRGQPPDDSGGGG